MPDVCCRELSRILESSKGTFVHTIPFFGDSRPEAIKLLKKWVDFVKANPVKVATIALCVQCTLSQTTTSFSML